MLALGASLPLLHFVFFETSVGNTLIGFSQRGSVILWAFLECVLVAIWMTLTLPLARIWFVWIACIILAAAKVGCQSRVRTGRSCC
jgi:hypothetical protein